MAVWIPSEKKWAKSKSSRRIEVEWQTKHPDYDSQSDSNGQMILSSIFFDPSLHPYHYMTFAATDAGRSKAIAFAKSKVAESFFGKVLVGERYLKRIIANAYDWDTVPGSIEFITNEKHL